jgi:hypothetical protein
LSFSRHAQGNAEIQGVHVGYGLFVRLDKLRSALEHLSTSLRSCDVIIDHVSGLIEYKTAKEFKNLLAFTSMNSAFVVVKNLLFPSNTAWLFQVGMSRQKKAAEQPYCAYRLGLAVCE